jgi:hypothetical protein
MPGFEQVSQNLEGCTHVTEPDYPTDNADAAVGCLLAILIWIV